MKKLLRLWKARASIQKELLKAGKSAWPIGSVVRFKKWGAWIEAEVLDVSDFNECILIRNNRTGKEYRIEYYNVLGYASAGS